MQPSRLTGERATTRDDSIGFDRILADLCKAFSTKRAIRDESPDPEGGTTRIRGRALQKRSSGTRARIGKRNYADSSKDFTRKVIWNESPDPEREPRSGTRARFLAKRDGLERLPRLHRPDFGARERSVASLGLSCNAESDWCDRRTGRNPMRPDTTLSNRRTKTDTFLQRNLRQTSL